MKNRTVEQFMSPDLVAAKPDMKLAELVALFAEHGVRALPVADDDNRLVGVISESDLFLKEKGVPFSMGQKVPSLLGEAIGRERLDSLERCQQVTVGEVMSTSAITAAKNATLEDVAMLMHERRLALLPVAQDGELVGVVRRISVLKEIYGGGSPSPATE